MNLIVATQNQHKLVEIRDMLSLPGLNILGSDALDPIPTVIEDGSTFEENALKKAHTYAQASGTWCMGDDSGICVAALDGAPGIRSARFAGEAATDQDNNKKLHDSMESVSDRRAWFYCALALAAPDGREWVLSGRCDGQLIRDDRGTGGFGYDPLFIPDGYDQTFGEMSPDEKNRISHRRRALDAARAEWTQLLSDEA